MDYRGKEIVLSQANEIAVVPFLLSTYGYGILWNNYSKTIFSEFQNKMSFMSEFGVVDYCLVSGKSADQIISGYRQLTGKAPMFKKSAYGFWQSKERYGSFDELIETVAEYRKRSLPIDNIVQDWRYWGDNSMWSSMYFEPYYYPNPADHIKQLHDLNVNLMCSVWPAVGDRSHLYSELKEKNLLFAPKHWSSGYLIDFYNPEAKSIYYHHLKRGLLDNGVDAIWFDGTEPEVDHTATREHTEKSIKELGMSYLGDMKEFLNTYSLEVTKGIYENYRTDNWNNRLFILTRSVFAGQQRYGAVTWSGDIGANWNVMRKQISAGLNFCMSGIPYWTHDIGAFFPSGNGGKYPSGIADSAYCELYARWFQFGVFTPIFRSHGTGTPREVYRFASNDLVYNSLKTSLNLRYRLLPYIYSNAWHVYNDDYTLMRALPMDFSDKRVKHIDNSYMFGPSLLVQPVTVPMYYKSTNGQDISDRNMIAKYKKNGTFYKQLNTLQTIYLPSGSNWYDFWNGKIYKGGKYVTVSSPLDRLPLFVKAGTILPMGPFIQYATEKSQDPIEIRIYRGKDASFTLYEDDANTYNYEKGQYATIDFSWNDSSKELVISERKGHFDGMNDMKKFNVVLVDENCGIGIEVVEKGRMIDYYGKAVKIDW